MPSKGADWWVEMARFLKGFAFREGEYRYREVFEAGHRFRFVRNFLMEAGVVAFEPSDGSYRLTGEMLWLYERAVQGRTGSSFDAMTELARRRELVGLAAEEQVVNFEKERLGSAFEGDVIHVGKLDSAAGYDVVSRESGEDSRRRYIEVKAVSPVDWEFYWSEHEIAVARAYGERYFLYLVPVSDSGVLVRDLLMICDPSTAVLGKQSGWSVKRDGLRCSRFATGDEDNE
ncbi:DUF3883 domain-containing protein [Haloferula sp. A504]|uniref:DUF3883 domain-containing protein n=1 Tax=Haloferula sp. A504 TaxID=3373601 RepID=UPI0031CC31F2|nr:DUF3883 domain-containing protein [Verrucomicrobiaceae bacterium E54]